MSGVVIVGAGQAGFQTAASLRLEGFSGPITLIGDEPHLPYQRPPLSKGVLAGKQTVDSLPFRPEKFYEDHSIELLLSQRAVSIDRDARRVGLASRMSVEYDYVVLATGARVRKLPVPGVLYLRDTDDALELKGRLESAATVAIVGGGFIGLEVASVARAMGKTVTLVEAQNRLMSRCVAPVVSQFFHDTHMAEGVTVILNSTEIPRADLIVAGVGVLANVELAHAAGLTVRNGIVVDAFLKTSDSNIFAIGDCAEAVNGLRLESVHNAADQARSVATQIVHGPSAYRAVPWFWTDQFDIKLQMAGISSPRHKAVLRGTTESRKFSVFYFDGADRLAAVDSVNRPGDHMVARKMLAARTALTAEQAGDESVDLKGLL
jgi:3-phenylpropionate/trans-cinnamate dioxygenase ferredoxin reductase component